MILNEYIPAAVQRHHPGLGYVPLRVDWSRARVALNYPLLRARVQDSINATLADLGLRQATVNPNAGQPLDGFFNEVERICLEAGCRPLHLWDEAQFLFQFDRPNAPAMFDAIRSVLYRPLSKGPSRFALTGTASHMLLRVIAQQYPSGTDPLGNTAWIVIPSPDSSNTAQCKTLSRACERALQAYYASGPVGDARVTVAEMESLYSNNGDVLTPAVAVTLASMVTSRQTLASAVVDLNLKMDAVRAVPRLVVLFHQRQVFAVQEWILEALQTLWFLPMEQRHQLRQVAASAGGSPVSLEFTRRIPYLFKVKDVMFNVAPDGKTGRMVARYADRLLRALSEEDGEINVSQFQYARAGITFNLLARVALAQSFGEQALMQANVAGSPVRRLAREALARYLRVVEPSDPLSLPWLCDLRDTLSATGTHNVVTKVLPKLQAIAGGAPPEDIALLTLRMVRLHLLHGGPLSSVPFAAEIHATGVMNFVEGFAAALVQEWVQHPPAGVNIRKVKEMWGIV